MQQAASSKLALSNQVYAVTLVTAENYQAHTHTHTTISSII